MKIKYYFRHPDIAHSIHRVFRTVINELPQAYSIKKIDMPCKGSMPWDVLGNCFYSFKYRDKSSIHHVTGHIHDVLLALVGCKTILTIHDLVFIDNVKNPIKRFYKWLFWLYLPVKISNVAVCISQHTASNLLSHIKSTKIKVIYNPIDPIFKACPKEFNKAKPIVLHIGTGWNKNLERTVEALSNISCHLRIVGKLNTEQLACLQNNKVEYSNVVDLTDEDIKDEYINCDIVNFPSLYEGFGMPIIEGQAIGRVVVCSQIEPLIEVSGNAVQYINPYSVDSMHIAYVNVINNSALRYEIIERGLVNVNRFRAENIAKQYTAIYNSLLN